MTTQMTPTKSKDPNAVAVHNGQIFGLDVSFDDSNIIVQSIPWDVTTSYQAGTRLGPNHIIEASYQLDLVSPLLKNASDIKLHTLNQNPDWDNQSQELRQKAEIFLNFLEKGGDSAKSAPMSQILELINKQSELLSEDFFKQTQTHLSNNKKVLTLGGDHSVSLGPIKAYANKYKNLSVLHFDAHADLRPAYEGFKESHASIMYNVINQTTISNLVQVGIRDVSEGEVELIKSNSKITTYFDWDLKKNQCQGMSWDEQCSAIIKNLNKHVYISFDIDGLDPKLCPNTGTPVAGGLEIWQVTHLLDRLLRSGHIIVGADLVEVAPDLRSLDNQWNGNVGARVAFLLVCALASTSAG